MFPGIKGVLAEESPNIGNKRSVTDDKTPGPAEKILKTGGNVPKADEKTPELDGKTPVTDEKTLDDEKGPYENQIQESAAGRDEGKQEEQGAPAPQLMTYCSDL